MTIAIILAIGYFAGGLAVVLLLGKAPRSREDHPTSVPDGSVVPAELDS